MKNTSAANISRETAIHLPASPLSKTESMIWCSVFSVASFLIVIGNFFTIILFKSNKRFRKRSLLFVINMAFADLILGTLALPMSIYITISMKNYQHWMGNVDSLWTVPYFSITTYTFSLMVSLNFAVFNIVREVLRHILAIQTPDNNSSNLQHFYFYGVVTQSAVWHQLRLFAVAQEFYQICSVILRYCCSNNYLCFQYRDLEKDQAQTCRLTAAKQRNTKCAFD